MGKGNEVGVCDERVSFPEDEAVERRINRKVLFIADSANRDCSHDGPEEIAA